MKVVVQLENVKTGRHRSVPYVLVRTCAQSKKGGRTKEEGGVSAEQRAMHSGVRTLSRRLVCCCYHHFYLHSSRPPPRQSQRHLREGRAGLACVGKVRKTQASPVYLCFFGAAVGRRALKQATAHKDSSRTTATLSMPHTPDPPPSTPPPTN